MFLHFLFSCTCGSRQYPHYSGHHHSSAVPQAADCITWTLPGSALPVSNSSALALQLSMITQLRAMSTSPYHGQPFPLGPPGSKWENFASV